jgi:broad specificity phosphatase PhoE
MSPTVRALAATLALVFLACACGGVRVAPRGRSVAVVRHAEAWKNVADPTPVLGAVSDSLTPDGRQQAEQLARWIDRTGSIELVLSSPAVRAVQTAEAIARECGVPLVVVDALRPLDAGEPPMSWTERVLAWEAGEDRRGSGGESLRDGVSRAMSAIRGSGARSLVVVSHGDITAGLVGEMLGTRITDRVALHELPTGACAWLGEESTGWGLAAIGPKGIDEER